MDDNDITPTIDCLTDALRCFGVHTMLRPDTEPRHLGLVLAGTLFAHIVGTTASLAVRGESSHELMENRAAFAQGWGTLFEELGSGNADRLGHQTQLGMLSTFGDVLCALMSTFADPDGPPGYLTGAYTALGAGADLAYLAAYGDRQGAVHAHLHSAHDQLTTALTALFYGAHHGDEGEAHGGQ